MANQILSVSETEITIGDTITINCSKPSYYMEYFAFYLYVGNVQISSFSVLPYTLNYSFENSGTHIISLKGESYTGIRDIETVTVTVNDIDHSTGSWSINNKTVQSLTIGNKEIQTIERVSDGAIIYQKPPSYELTFASDKTTADIGETVTLTATLTLDDVAVSGETVTFTDGTNTLGTSVTNSNGVATLIYSWDIPNVLNIYATYNNSISNKVTITLNECLLLVFTGTTFTIYSTNRGLSGSDMIIDWGDGSTTSLSSDAKIPSHTYSENKTHKIRIKGSINSLGTGAFRQTPATKIFIPNGVTLISTYAFKDCTNLVSIHLPSTITRMGSHQFDGCSNLIDCQLYWNTPLSYNTTYFSNTNTYFTIPNGTTANYVAQNYPSAKLIERSA